MHAQAIMQQRQQAAACVTVHGIVIHHSSSYRLYSLAWYLSMVPDKLLTLAGKGPLDNLFDHLANPAAINFTTNGVSLPGIPYLQP